MALALRAILERRDREKEGLVFLRESSRGQIRGVRREPAMSKERTGVRNVLHEKGIVSPREKVHRQVRLLCSERPR